MDKEFLADLYWAAVDAANPATAITRHLPAPPSGKTLVVGVGKAAVPMLQALQKAWSSPLRGIVVTTDAQDCSIPGVEVLVASHPVPDIRGLRAARKIVRLLEGLSADDLVIALVSGGGSALLPSPPPGLSLDDEIEVNRVLLASGAPISAMNTVRKHVSTVKGGRLAALTAARVHTILVSDIPGDVASHVSSGPTIPDSSTREDALAVIDSYQMTLPRQVMAHLRSEDADAPHPGDEAFQGHTYGIVASARVSLEAAADAAMSRSHSASVLSDAIEGEAREVGVHHATLAKEARAGRQSSSMVLLSGGETTVSVKGSGRGGRNGEFLLAWALAMDGVEGVTAIAADTDGIDGSEENAGAFADGNTAARLREMGLDGQTLLANNDSYSAFAALGDLFVTGATGTNVNDFRAILVEPI